jgi:hypothetical protein
MDFCKSVYIGALAFLLLVHPAIASTPADFDGDGKTDVALFRPLTGEWFLRYSRDNSFGVTRFGESGDRITPGDFNGDRATDYAVFRPSESNWYINTGSRFIVQRWGESGDIPV